MNIAEAIEKYPTMTPRERTIAVGVHVLGWEYCEPSRHFAGYLYHPESLEEEIRFGPIDLHGWADTWAGTGAIIDHMRAEGWIVSPECHPDGSGYVELFNQEEHWRPEPVSADTIHEAVALAALRATAAQ